MLGTNRLGVSSRLGRLGRSNIRGREFWEQSSEEDVQLYVKKFDGKKTAMSCQVPKKFGGDGEESRKLTNVEAWWRAKEIVSENGGVVQDKFTDDDWGLVTTIFKNMMGVSKKSEMLELRCKFLDGIEDLGLLPVADAYELLDDAMAWRLSRFNRG